MLYHLREVACQGSSTVRRNLKHSWMEMIKRITPSRFSLGAGGLGTATPRLKRTIQQSRVTVEFSPRDYQCSSRYSGSSSPCSALLLLEPTL